MTEVLKILERSRSSIHPGLERMRSAMSELGMNQKTLPPSVLIGGTNGKGSTSGILWRLLSLSGIRCGLYTSPHVLSFHERIQVSHLSVDLEFLDQELEDLRKKLSPALYEELTFFELTTLLAFYVFQRSECEWMVLEVGLGGRWDASNAIEPMASAIVSIDFDHQEWLGDTLQKIAGEKLGIARRDRPLFWGDLCYKDELEPTLQAASSREGFDLFRVKEHFAEEEGMGFVNLPGLPSLSYALPEWCKGRAEVFKSNFALAFSMFYWLADRLPFLSSEGRRSFAGDPSASLGVTNHSLVPVISSGAQRSREISYIAPPHNCVAPPHLIKEDPKLFCLRSLTAFDQVNLPPWPYSFLGRMQRMQIKGNVKTWDFYLDVCHNIASVREFVRSLKAAGLLESGKKLPGFVSILRDKDLEPMVQLLREVLDPFVIFKIDHERSITKERLTPQHKDLVLYEDFAELWNDFADRVSSPVVICGSFYAVGKVIEYFRAYPKTFSGQSMLYAYDPRDLLASEHDSSTSATH